MEKHKQEFIIVDSVKGLHYVLRESRYLFDPNSPVYDCDYHYSVFRINIEYAFGQNSSNSGSIVYLKKNEETNTFEIAKMGKYWGPGNNVKLVYRTDYSVPLWKKMVYYYRLIFQKY